MRLLLLDKKQQVFKVLYRNKIKEAAERLEINKANQFNASFLLSKEIISDFDKARYVGVPVHNGSEREYHVYSIQTAKTNGNFLEVTGLEEAYDDLNAGFIKEFRNKNKPLIDNLKIITDGTRWEIGSVADVNNSDVYYYFINKREGLSKIVKAFGIEVQFIYEISGNKITKRILNTYKQLGKETHKRYTYGSNVMTIEREEDRTSVSTAIVGLGKGVETDNGGYGRKLNLSGVSWSVANGDPLDKPIGQLYLEMPKATEKYGLPDGRPRISTVTWDNCEDVNELINLTYQQLITNSKPALKYTVDILDASELWLGDTVTTIRHDLGFAYKDRVSSINRDLLNESKTTVEIGAVTFKSERERDEQTQNQIDNTNNNVDQVQSNVGEVSKDVDDLKSSNEDTQQLMDELKKKVSDTRDNMLGYINGSGRDVIRFLPDRENPTDIVASESGGNYGMRWNSKGIYYDGKGTVAIDNRGNVYADNFVGQSITGIHIRGGELSAVTISGDTDISLGSGSTRTSVTRYGISTPNMTVYQIDGLKRMDVSQYADIGGANLWGDGSGKLYIGPYNNFSNSVRVVTEAM